MVLAAYVPEGAKMKLCYTALSPFCRKVRMAMEYKGLAFDVVEADAVHDIPAFNPRAEVPVLMDGDITVCNSADILGYLDRKFPDRPLYPAEATAYADVREWERWADTHVDAVMTDLGVWKFAELPPMPDGLMEAGRREMNIAYDRLSERLTGRDFVCGAISAADFAFYPHVASGAFIGLPFDPRRHAPVLEWMKRMRARPEGQNDLAYARDWWANRAASPVDTQRINWGTYRLEWFLASGFHEFLFDQIRKDKVLWSTGPNNNAVHCKVKPEWFGRTVGAA